LKVSLNWIKDYINLDGISTKDIIEKLTMSGLEVEDAVDESEIYKDFVVSYVKDKKKHPKRGSGAENSFCSYRHFNSQW
jgi:phenylalanyl-tRNA synthetase beta chain